MVYLRMKLRRIRTSYARCSECGPLTKGQHESDCPRVKSEVQATSSEQVTLHAF